MGNATSKMPVLFLGHGSPMNAIEENEFSTVWREISKSIPLPESIVCISAHWETIGTWITSMDNPRTIHDFYGFPKQLYEVIYPAPGNPVLAENIRTTVREPEIGADSDWGLDHGAWSVIRHLYPEANIPVLQLSLDRSKNASWHFDFAGKLNFLRENRVLVIGSGNIVHNLRMIDWNNPNGGHPWAEKAHSILQELILAGDSKSLVDFKSLGKEVELSIPTPEHYLPLLYTLALKNEDDQISLFNDKVVMGSIAMTSLFIQQKP